MMQFILIAHDRPDALALRSATRPEHLAYLESIADRIVFAGPMLDEAGTPRGSMIVYEADDLATAEKLAADDPYSKAGLFGQVELRGFRTVVRDGVVAG